MIKIKDIAKETGYSITTVSKAFNNYKDISDEAKSAILNKAKEMGYIPNATARGLATKKSFMIGVIFDEMLGYGFRHPFFGAVIEYFKKEIEKAGYDIVFISESIGQSSVSSYLDHCKQRGVDGIFIACADFQNERIQQLVNSQIPAVTVEVTSDKIHSVNTDDDEGMQSAVSYLYGLGHRRIGHIAGSQTTYPGMERLKGYKTAMIRLGLCIDESYIVNGDMFSFESGYQAMKKLMALENPPTAITTAADMLALGAIRCIYDHGKTVPNDFSIIGYDNIDMLEYMTPSLTTVGQNASAMGKKAADLLIRNMANKSMKKKEVLIGTSIIERETCKKRV